MQDDSGGGSGGSIWIGAGNLVGAGTISATGGAGDLFGGGGGGGGRIAIYCPSNQFTGSYDISGGSGANAGGIGSLFFSTNLTPVITIAGSVTDTNGQPIAGVNLQAISNLVTNSTVLTDTNGAFLLTMPEGWSGDVVPALTTNVFIPSLRSYNTAMNSFSNQNFTLLPGLDNTINLTVTTTNLQFGWNGIAGVTYWPEWSTNLIDWNSLYGPLAGSNGVMQTPAIEFDEPAKFFRLRASY